MTQEEINSLNYANLYRTSVVYEKLAQLLPTEGRDYNLKISYPESGDNVSISFEPITELGKMWCDYCRKALKGSV